jgi:S-adenosylmethionine-dependent methyltransferase
MSDPSAGPVRSDGTFSIGRDAWTARLGNLRNVVRQELITRQLAAHLPPAPARVLDVGAGQGTQAIRLAARGYLVTAVEPDAEMRELFTVAASEHADAVRARLDLRAGRLGELAQAVCDSGGGTGKNSVYDVVLCHGVLMYLQSAKAAIAELAGLVAPGGLLAVAARSAAFLPWRPLLRNDWGGAQRAFEELDLAAAEGRDARYVNEIGSPARADTVDGLTRLCEAAGLRRESWYGVRIASDDQDLAAPVPADEAELARMLEIEERLGRTDPYRQLGALFHLIARRPALTLTG